MKIRVNRNALLPVATIIGSVVEKRQTLPILSNILLNASSGQLSLTATDLEVEITTSLEIEGNADCDFTLPARKFVDICKALPEGAEIEISVQNEKALIKSGRSRFSLSTLSAADYPGIEITATEHSFQISENELKTIIEKTAFSMAHQDVRYYLNGMLIEIETDKIKSVATDGHRLAIYQSEYSHQLDENFSFLLPRKAVMELGRLLDHSDSLVNIDVTSSLVRFKIGKTIFTSKLIDGKFPDYERVIPRNCDKTAVIEKESFKNALIRASILSSDKYKGIRITVGNDTLKLQAHNPEQEEAEEEMPIQYGNPELTIGFNVGYLLDILNTVGQKNILMDFADTNSSSIVRIPGNDEALYVVMPMRL